MSIKTNYMENGYNVSKTDEDEIIQIPYNINNVLITEENVKEILAINNVKIEKVNDLKIIQKAFVHKSM